MLKYIKHNMETIEGIEIYPIISFLIFFVLFIGMLIYVIRQDRRTIEEISLLPLDSENNTRHEKAK